MTHRMPDFSGRLVARRQRVDLLYLAIALHEAAVRPRRLHAGHGHGGLAQRADRQPEGSREEFRRVHQAREIGRAHV